jgi:transposase InsO family protein
MEENIRNQIALFRYGILAPYIQRQVDTNVPWTFFKDATDKKYQYIDGTFRNVSPSSLGRWLKAYNEKGFDGLKPIRRSDIGKQRKIDGELSKKITYYVEEYPRLPATQIYEKLISDDEITSKEISLSTITRFVSSLKKNKDLKPLTEYKRYEKEHINEVWYGDTTYGPYITIDGKKQRVYIIALIDDASRKIVGCEAFLEDNYINLMKVIKSAVSTCGKPKLFSFDNGSNYRSNQMFLLGARIGVAINYCPPYTPTSKSKIERFFKTLKDHYLCLIKPNDYHDLKRFNEDLRAYIQKYNTTPHSSLEDNMTPNDRFYKESNIIIEIDQESIEKSFLLELERKVSPDSVVIIDNKEYEVDYHYQNQRILLRYSPDLSKVYIVDKNDDSLKEIKLLDKKSNSSIKRKKISLSEISE